MKKENIVVSIAMLYAFLGVGIIAFASSVINYFNPIFPFSFAIILAVLVFNIYLMFSFQRIWDKCFSRGKE